MQTGYHSPAGGAYLLTSQDNSVPTSPMVHLQNRMQISTVAAQPPGEHRATYDPAWCEQGYAPSHHFQDSRQFSDNSGQQRDSSKHYFSEPLRNISELRNDAGLSGQLCTDKVLAVGLPKLYTDDEICEYIKEKRAYLMINLNHGPATSSKGCANDNDSPLQSQPKSTTCDKEDVERQSLSYAVIEHCTTATGQALEEDNFSKVMMQHYWNGDKGDMKRPEHEEFHFSFHFEDPVYEDISEDENPPIQNTDVEMPSLPCDVSELSVKPYGLMQVQRKYLLDEELIPMKQVTPKTETSSAAQLCFCPLFDGRDDSECVSGAKCDHASNRPCSPSFDLKDEDETDDEMDDDWDVIPLFISELKLESPEDRADPENVLLDVGEHLLTSAEYPQILNEAAATGIKTEEEGPVVLTAVPGVTRDELTEKYPSLILSCSTSQEESKSDWIHADKDDRVPAGSSTLIHMTHRDRLDEGLKPVEVDNVQDMMKYSKDSWTPRIIGDEDANVNKQKNIRNQQHSPVTSKEAAAHSNSSVVKVQSNEAQSVTTNQSEQSVCDQTSCKSMRRDASYVCSQVDLSRTFPDNQHAELTPLSRGVDKEVLQEFQYEDISDAEDVSELDMKRPEHEEFHFSLHFEDPVYEDISEDENPPIQNTDVEMPSLPRDVSELSVKPYGHMQVQRKSLLDEELIPMKQVTPKTETSSAAQLCFCPLFDGRDDSECVSGAKCDHASTRPCSPSFDLKNEDETDDEMDDDWDVIPLFISELKLESPEDRADPENVLLDVGEHVDKVTHGDTSPTLCELRLPPPVQVPAFSQIEVFDTLESFQQAKAVQFLFLCLPERDPKSHHSRRDSYSEPEDSCETDDSCNYSPVEESNHLTVSKKLFNSLSALASSETNDTSHETEKETVDDEATNLQNDQTRQNTCEKEDIIVLSSDTDDECDQICANIAKRWKSFSLQNEVRAAEPCSSEKRHSSETVASVCESVQENLFKGGLLSAHSSKRTQNSGHFCKNTVRSEHVQHEATQKNVSNDESIITKDSDTEDDSSQHYRKAKRKREFSSGWAGAGNDPCGKQDRTPVDTEYETAKKKLQKCRPSADSSKQQHGSKHRDTHLKEEMQDTCSDLLYSIKRGQLREAETSSVRVQQKVNAQMTSNRFHESDHMVSTDNILRKKAKAKRRSLSSETEDSDSAFVNAQKSPHVSNKPKINGQSSKDSCEKQLQSDATMSRNPVVPRLFVQSCPQSNGRLKLYVQAIGQHKDETPKKPTSASKKFDSCKTATQLFNGDRQGKSTTNSKPTDDRHHVTPQFKSNESSSCPRNISSSSRLQRQHSYSIPSSFIHPYSPTKGPSAKTQVTNMWRESYFSTRMEKGLRPKKTYDFLKETKHGHRPYDKAPRWRNSSQESATPLMRRTMEEARELTKARRREVLREQTGCRVREGYKWKT